MSHEVCALSTVMTKPVRIDASLAFFVAMPQDMPPIIGWKMVALRKMNYELIMFTWLYSYDWLCTM